MKGEHHAIDNLRKVYRMSRTIRRKDNRAKHHIAQYILTEVIDWFWVDAKGEIIKHPNGYEWSLGWQRVTIDPNSLEGKKLVMNYQRDGRKYYYSYAPASWCNVFQRSMRNQAKQELHKFCCNLEYEPLIQANHRRSASYDWW